MDWLSVAGKYGFLNDYICFDCKEFLTTLEISHLENKIDSLTQQIAIERLKEGEEEVPR